MIPRLVLLFLGQDRNTRLGYEGGVALLEEPRTRGRGSASSRGPPCWTTPRSQTGSGGGHGERCAPPQPRSGRGGQVRRAEHGHVEEDALRDGDGAPELLQNIPCISTKINEQTVSHIHYYL